MKELNSEPTYRKRKSVYTHGLTVKPMADFCLQLTEMSVDLSKVSKKKKGQTFMFCEAFQNSAADY